MTTIKSTFEIMSDKSYLVRTGAVLIGCCISFTIEALQFWFIKGFSEVDDVMHNTVGCLIGLLIVSGFHHITAAVNHLQRTSR